MSVSRCRGGWTGSNDPGQSTGHEIMLRAGQSGHTYCAKGNEYGREAVAREAGFRLPRQTKEGKRDS